PSHAPQASRAAASPPAHESRTVVRPAPTARTWNSALHPSLVDTLSRHSVGVQRSSIEKRSISSRMRATTSLNGEATVWMRGGACMGAAAWAAANTTIASKLMLIYRPHHEKV